MPRFMPLLAALLFASVLAENAARADLPPPPPPKGKKYVSVQCEVILAKDVGGYVFVQQTAQGPGAPRSTFQKLELTEKPATMPAAGRYTYVTLWAVPADAAKQFKSDQELFQAM